MTTSDFADRLNTVPLFRGLKVDSTCCFFRKIKKNRIANETYSGREYVGVILSGNMDVYSILADDTEVRLSQLSGGDLFGICNLFYSYDRETILKCRSDCDIIYIAKEDFRKLLLGNAEMMKRYLRLCNEKIAFLLRRTETLAMQSGRTKVIVFLLKNASNGRVMLRDSRETWAKSLGMSRATLFRELSDLKKKDLISISRSEIIIRNPEELEQGIG